MLGVRVPPALFWISPPNGRIPLGERSVQGTQRYVVFAYLALGFLVFMTLDRLLGALVYRPWRRVVAGS